MATQGQIDVKDFSGASQPVDGFIVSNTGSAPGASQALRQSFAIGDSGTGANGATVDGQGDLHVIHGKWQTTETTALFGSNGTFTGTTHDSTLTGERWASATARPSNQSSAANGFIIQISDDATNWVIAAQATASASQTTIIDTLLTLRYWRVQYTNGASAQTGTFAVYSNASDTVPVPIAKAGSGLPQTTMGAVVVQGVVGGVKVPVDGSGVTQPISGSVSISGALSAGSNVIGKVGIDQTTPGTTNAVQVIGSLPAGSAIIGATIPLINNAPSNIPSTTGTMSSGGSNVQCLLYQGVSFVSFLITGSFTGSLTFYCGGGGGNSIQTNVYPLNSSTPQSTVTAAGTYWAPVMPGCATMGVFWGSYTSGSATVQINGATTPTVITPKGSQPIGGIATQDLKDSGRTQVYIGATQVAGTTSESVITCNITKGQAAQTAASTYTVTAGKTLRIQSIRYGVSGAVGVATIRLRLTSVSGAPIWEDSLNFGATTDNQASETQSFPDGLELSAGTVINWTQLCASTSQKVDVALVGFEY